MSGSDCERDRAAIEPVNEVRENCRRVLDRIRNAALKCGRDPSSIKLIAVTKKVPVARIREAAAAGISNVGENRLQEALPKREALADLPLAWHFIGHLQSNKARKAVEQFDWIHSVDRPDLAEKLSQAATRSLPVLIEVKLDDEPSKSGIPDTELSGFIERFPAYGGLELRGLMAIPPFFENSEQTRPYFRKLRMLGDRFGLKELSMGMSHDFEVAIQEGATMVRVGTAIFGERV